MPVHLRSSSFGLDTFAKHFKTQASWLNLTHLTCWNALLIDVPAFCRVRHGDSVTKTRLLLFSQVHIMTYVGQGHLIGY